MKKLVVLLLCLCAALSAACGNTAPAPKTEKAAQVQTTLANESDKLQTLFGKVNLKDSLDNVTKILGPAKTKKDHQESKDANGKTISTDTYVWSSGNGKTVITMKFVDGKLVDKNFKR
jgi:hypothetical protein